MRYLLYADDHSSFDQMLRLLERNRVTTHVPTWTGTWGTVAADDIPKGVQRVLIEEFHVDIEEDEQFEADAG